MDAGKAAPGYTPPPGSIYHTQDAEDILQIQPFASLRSLSLQKEGNDPSHPPIIEDETAFKPSGGWAEMIKKVYETDPLLCPKCRGQMSIISFIEDHKVIDKIIFHLKLTFMAERPPPPQAVQQELAAEDFAEYF